MILSISRANKARSKSVDFINYSFTVFTKFMWFPRTINDSEIFFKS